MKLFRIKLKLKTGFGTPFAADSLFGAVCWTSRYHEGEERFSEMLRFFLDGNPPFVLSSGFPGDLLPKPLLPPNRKRQELADPITSARENKRIKAVEWLTLEEFVEIVSGNEVVLSGKPKQLITSFTVHSTINRLTGTTGGSGGLYQQEENFLNSSSGYISLYVRVKQGWEERLMQLLSLLGQRGFGKKKSTGKGHFVVEGMEEFPHIDFVPGANGFVSLSPFIPAPKDPAEGYYRFAVKYGKLDEEFALAGNPFKRPVIMFSVGSTFYDSDDIRPFYGSMAEGVAPARPEVAHYGYALAVPTVLP